MKLEEIKKVIYLESVYLNSSQGYSRDILKPFTDFFKAYATAVTAMGDNAFDSRYIHYKYP